MFWRQALLSMFKHFPQRSLISCVRTHPKHHQCLVGCVHHIWSWNGTLLLSLNAFTTVPCSCLNFRKPPENAMFHPCFEFSVCCLSHHLCCFCSHNLAVYCLALFTQFSSSLSPYVPSLIPRSSYPRLKSPVQHHWQWESKLLNWWTMLMGEHDHSCNFTKYLICHLSMQLNLKVICN